MLDDCMIGINVEVWACPQYKGAVFPDMEISMIKIRRFENRLISIMGLPICQEAISK